MSKYLATTPMALLGNFLRNRGLLLDLIKRDFIGRYRGSFIGMAWSLFNPLLMLATYTFVFSVAFQARWGKGEESKVAFALVLFSGMIVHSFFADCMNRAPTLITSHPNYVKKVIFPLEILPWMALGSALLHFLVSLTVLLAFCILTGAQLQAGTVLIPLLMLPLLLITIGLMWGFASLGVYLPDLAQGMGMLTTIALFLAPVFYPIDALPKAYQTALCFNPITLPILQIRDVMFWGKPIDWQGWAISLAIGVVVCCLGFWWFQKTRKGFADVL